MSEIISINISTLPEQEREVIRKAQKDRKASKLISHALHSFIYGDDPKLLSEINEVYKDRKQFASLREFAIFSQKGRKEAEGEAESLRKELEGRPNNFEHNRIKGELETSRSRLKDLQQINDKMSGETKQLQQAYSGATADLSKLREQYANRETAYQQSVKAVQEGEERITELEKTLNKTLDELRTERKEHGETCSKLESIGNLREYAEAEVKRYKSPYRKLGFVAFFFVIPLIVILLIFGILAVSPSAIAVGSKILGFMDSTLSFLIGYVVHFLSQLHR